MKPYSLRRVCLASVLALAGCAAPEPDYRLYLDVGPERSAIGTKTGYARGKAHFEDGEFGLAIEAFHAALLNEGRSVEILNGLAAAYDKLGRFDLARRYYGEALAQEPTSAVTLHNLGYSHLLQGDLGQALQNMRAAYELDSKNEMIRNHFEMVSAIISRKQAALAEARPASADNRAPPPPEAWVQRDTAALQTLVTAPRSKFLTAVQKAGIDPRLVAYQEGRQMRLRWPSRADSDETRGPAVNRRPRTTSPQIEVSNGYGRRHMAARLARYLRSEGFRPARLTNQADFGKETSVIYCREGYEATARQLAGRLPLPVPVVSRSDTDRSEVVLVLGADLSGFDQALLKRFANEDSLQVRREFGGDLLEVNNSLSMLRKYADDQESHE